MNSIEFDIFLFTSKDQGNFLVPRLLIDNKIFADFNIYAIDLNELVDSKYRQGEFFIMTCWCGAPDCAGINSGIQVKHTPDYTFWKITFPFSQKELKFNHAQYLESIENLLLSIPQKYAQYREEIPNLEIVPYGCDPYLLGEVAFVPMT